MSKIKYNYLLALNMNKSNRNVNYLIHIDRSTISIVSRLISQKRYFQWVCLSQLIIS